MDQGSRETQIALLALICLTCVLIGRLVLMRETEHVPFVPKLIEQFVQSDTEKTQMTIPKIIHQVWNNDILPSDFIESVKSLARDNPFPEWQYYFWTRQSGCKFLVDKYPHLLKRFNNESATSDTMRADIIRIAVLHEYGGVYFDLDTMSVRPLANFVENQECSLALEPTEHFFGRDLEFLLTNAALFCRAQHPFYKHLINKLSILADDCLNAYLCTGPMLLTTEYKSNISKGVTVKLPEVQSSKLFQDKYDAKGARKMMYKYCGNMAKMAPKLSPFLREACFEWHERGRDNRTISDLAYTYHMWFHVYGKKLEELPTNSIFSVIPHAKIYGVNL